MFCPTCGSEERQLSQFCRSCGTDLRAVRAAGLGRPDSVTDAAADARAEIGRAIADKIREFKNPGELAKMVEDVLPRVEEFLETPEDKRLRRMRRAVIISAVGLGAMISFVAVALATDEPGVIFLSGLGLVTFFIGIAMMLNTKWFGAPKKGTTERAREAELKEALERSTLGAAGTQRELPPAQKLQPSSVIEHTTHRLSSDPALARHKRISVQDESRET